MKKKKVVYIVLGLSLILNILYFKFDTFDYLWPKIQARYFPEETINGYNKEIEKKIIDVSINMLDKDPVMIWSEPKGFTQTLLSSNHITSTAEFRLHNYPRAYLYYGLSEYLIKNNNQKKLLELKKSFDKLYDFDNLNEIKFYRIDQVPFGLTALNLYKHFKEDKYLKFSKTLYHFILEYQEQDGIISYRKGKHTVLNDMLGMIIPFLIKFDEYNKNNEKFPIVKKQLDYFIKYGIDTKTYMPSHAINKDVKVKVGSINWGRGIGWYAIALSQYYLSTGEYEIEINGLLSTLKSLKNSEQLWSQFPGNYERFDASTTTMILYSNAIMNTTVLNKQEIFKLLKNYISKDGLILETSGDTYAVNNYSNTYGKSELSQGMLLLLLANSK
ncbi:MULTISPECIES: glycoside hydrolase family 88 protein [Aequorivita]|uniref:Glycoside hydrolase family 88 protein n=1 Tax=Aequorivita iocasae TaxID=2803865 RepID=A0ABX7DS19_9FLAO|nr:MULTISPECIES: glycoside hydrolase family 88 protein [Aequorivita]QQX75954.1 glycoside hydrolase family 88 protein [Aequorivita iocasae]UCA55415.1 glycoside hydrolase family 88 protein [Aequorivita sp. F7]